MPQDRFFFEGDLSPQKSFVLEGKECHHATQVSRNKVGDGVEIVNGRGVLAKGHFEQIKKRVASIMIDEVTFQEPSKYELILAQAMPRLNRLENIVEKGSELGMTELWLFSGERSEKLKLSAGQLERLRGIAIAAMKQCGRLYLPLIVLKPPIQDWKTTEKALFYGDLRPDAPLIQSKPGEDVIIVIGPESGLSSGEEAHLRSLNGQGVKLHYNTLRTDTAAIAALTLLSTSQEC